MGEVDSGAEAQITALYELPLQEFTAGRNRLAQQLRRAGERELGDQVKSLRRPSVAAWTLNRVRNQRPELVDALLNAGAGLRGAQERLLERGERGVLREAAAQERKRVDETVRAAEGLLGDAGHAVNAALHNKLWETTHAAALDPELGETLRRGRLTEDRQISDLGLSGSLAGSGPDVTPVREKPPPQAHRRLAQARERKQKAEARLRAVVRSAAEAESQLAESQDALERAQAAVERAQSALERARGAVGQTQAELKHAREQLADATEQVDALGRQG